MLDHRRFFLAVESAALRDVRARLHGNTPENLSVFLKFAFFSYSFKILLPIKRLKMRWASGD